MDVRHDASIFTDLLHLNPWAKPYWAERSELVQSSSWNVNALNSGGNAATHRWLSRFHQARTTATLQRLLGETATFRDWMNATCEIVNPLEGYDAFNKARVGTPMKEGKGRLGRLWVSNCDEIVHGYSIGQFKADILLLAQPSIRNATVTEILDISEVNFVFGLDMTGASLEAPLIARKSCLGRYSELASREFDHVDFSQSSFLGHSIFTPTRFKKSAIFNEARFLEAADFQGVSFSGTTDFSCAVFEDGAEFQGASFSASPDFSFATFRGRSSFEDATFAASVDFSSSRFPGKVSIHGLPDEIRRMIIDADHSPQSGPDQTAH